MNECLGKRVSRWVSGKDSEERVSEWASGQLLLLE